MSWHQVQHTPRTAYNVYSIHQVQHLHKTVRLPFIQMITSWPLNVASFSGIPPYTINHHQSSSPWELNAKFTLSQSHVCQLKNWWMESQHLARLSIDCLQVLVQSRTIPASKFAQLWPPKCISKLAWLRPSSASPNSLNYSLQTCTIAASKCISKLVWLRRTNCLIAASMFARSWPPSTYLQTRMITASKCIYKLAWSLPPSVSQNLLNYGLQVRTIMASKCIYTLARSLPWSVSLWSLNRNFEAHLELLPSTASSQSRYTVCRWVAM